MTLFGRVYCVVLLFIAILTVVSSWKPQALHLPHRFAIGAISRTEVDFQPANIRVSAPVGQKFEDTAREAGVEIQYKCKKGECGTCEIRVDGKWTRTCQLTVPSLPKGEILRVTVPANKGPKKSSTFFSPASFVEGVVNNGLGVVGFVGKALAADKEFDKRMEKERLQQEKIAARRRREQEQSNNR